MNNHNEIENFFGDEHCPSSDELFGYARASLNQEEMHRVERHLIDCPFCSDALEGISSVGSIDKHEESVVDINEEIDRRAQKRRIVFIPQYYALRIAAVALVLLLAGGTYIYFKSIMPQNNELGDIPRLQHEGKEQGIGANEIAEQFPELKEPILDSEMSDSDVKLAEEDIMPVEAQREQSIASPDFDLSRNKSGKAVNRNISSRNEDASEENFAEGEKYRTANQNAMKDIAADYGNAPAEKEYAQKRSKLKSEESGKDGDIGRHKNQAENLATADELLAKKQKAEKKSENKNDFKAVTPNAPAPAQDKMPASLPSGIVKTLESPVNESSDLTVVANAKEVSRELTNVEKSGSKSDEKLNRELTLFAQGMAQFNQENYKSAIKIFKKAINANQEHTDAEYHLALSCLKINDYVTAKKHFLNLINKKENSRKTETKWYLAQALLSLNENSEARIWLINLSEYDNPFRNQALELLKKY